MGIPWLATADPLDILEFLRGGQRLRHDLRQGMMNLSRLGPPLRGATMTPLVGKLGFLGAGRMASALVRGWLAAGLLRSEQVLASDPVPQALEGFAGELGVAVTSDNRRVAWECT